MAKFSMPLQALEAWDSYSQYKREEEFKKAIKQMVENFELQRKEQLELINSNEFKEKFFNEYIVLTTRLNALAVNLTENQEQQKRFNAWRQQAEILNNELRVVVAS